MLLILSASTVGLLPRVGREGTSDISHEKPSIVCVAVKELNVICSKRIYGNSCACWIIVIERKFLNSNLVSCIVGPYGGFHESGVLLWGP